MFVGLRRRSARFGGVLMLLIGLTLFVLTFAFPQKRVVQQRVEVPVRFSTDTSSEVFDRAFEKITIHGTDPVAVFWVFPDGTFRDFAGTSKTQREPYLRRGGTVRRLNCKFVGPGSQPLLGDWIADYCVISEVGPDDPALAG